MNKQVATRIVGCLGLREMESFPQPGINIVVIY